MQTYTIVYDSNGADLGQMENSIMVYGKDSPIRKCTFSKEGYRFAGWFACRKEKNMYVYADAAGKRKFFVQGKNPPGTQPYLYRDGFHFKKLTNIDGDVITLVAQWTPDIHLIDAPKKAEDNQNILRNILTNRPLVLLGDANRCVNFCHKYSGMVHIRAAFSKQEEAVGTVIGKSDGHPIVMEAYHKSKIKKDDYIIVCSPMKIRLDFAYKDMVSTLNKLGIVHAKHYLRDEVAGAILQHKKLWIWLGFCQLDILRNQIFNKIPSIKSQYLCIGFRDGLDTIKSSYKYQECQDLIQCCDILLYTDLIFTKSKRDVDISKAVLPRNAISFIYPRIAFRAYYPYKDTNFEDWHRYTFDGKAHFPILYRENAIDDLILAGKTDDEIYEELMRADFISEKEIKKNLKIAYKSIQISEHNADLKILDYIQENLTKRMLFRDGLHYTNGMYFEIARRISKKLGFDIKDNIDRLEAENRKSGEIFISYPEIPVLPCVAKALGMDFITDHTLWLLPFSEQGKFRGTPKYLKMVTRKEWIYTYIAYTRANMTLKEMWPADITKFKADTPQMK